MSISAVPMRVYSREELERGWLSARGCDRVLKVAWTLADLAGRSAPGRSEVAEAIGLRTGRGAAVAA